MGNQLKASLKTETNESRHPADPASPVFLVGAERSGTTLLRLMLDHHPQMTWINEFAYAVDWVPSNGWPDVEEYRRKLLDDRIFMDSGLKIDPSLDYVELVNDFLRQWRQRSGKPFVGAQVHRHFGKILRLWPEARFIHLLRDPRDVARSRIQMGWAGNTWHATRVWIETEQKWEEVRANIPPNRQIDVYYENLVRQPESELRRICKHIGVTYDARMLKFHTDTTYEPVNVEFREKWRHQLTSREIQLVEADAAGMMRERGYELSGLPSIRVVGLTRVALAIQNRYKRVRFRVRKYGMELWLEDVIFRRLSEAFWRKRVLKRIQAVNRGRVK